MTGEGGGGMTTRHPFGRMSARRRQGRPARTAAACAAVTVAYPSGGAPRVRNSEHGDRQDVVDKADGGTDGYGRAPFHAPLT